MSLHKNVKNEATFKQNYSLRLFIAFKITYLAVSV